MEGARLEDDPEGFKPDVLGAVEDVVEGEVAKNGVVEEATADVKLPGSDKVVACGSPVVVEVEGMYAAGELGVLKDEVLEAKLFGGGCVPEEVELLRELVEAVNELLVDSYRGDVARKFCVVGYVRGVSSPGGGGGGSSKVSLVPTGPGMCSSYWGIPN